MNPLLIDAPSSASLVRATVTRFLGEPPRGPAGRPRALGRRPPCGVVLARGGSGDARSRPAAGDDHRAATAAQAGAGGRRQAAPKPQRATAPPAPVAAQEAAAAAAQDAPAIEPTAEAIAAGPAPPVEAVAAEPAASTPELPPKMLPPRVDLVYKAFLGTQGFLVGEAAYRFEHAANEYRITTIGEARGLAALFVRGQGKLESRGFITAAGLQPLEFSVERGSKERRETAVFDWEAGVVTLHEQKTQALAVPTFDPLALMWQAYFQPPADDTQELDVATTRRVGHYTVTREGTETIRWPAGEVATERWHRRSEDGKTDAYFWLAPSLHYVPVKIRVTANFRGVLEATLEAVLDSIRVDEKNAPQ